MKKTVKKDFSRIYLTYKACKKNKIGLKSGSVAEWLCDNFYIFEEEYAAIQSLRLTRRSSKQSAQKAYDWAVDFLTQHQYVIEEQTLFAAMQRAQTSAPFSIGELRFLPYALRCGLLSRAAKDCQSTDDEGVMGNIVRSLIALRDLDYDVLFETYSMIDKILSKDKIYPEMNASSKDVYRRAVSKMAYSSRKSESEVCEKAYMLVKQKKGKQSHVGYYLIGEGENLLRKELGLPPHKEVNKPVIYIGCILFFSLAFAYGLAVSTHKVFWSILSIIPLMDAIITLLQYLLLKTTPVRPLPALKLSNGIPESVLIVYPTLLSSVKKGEEMAKKLEICYLANRDKNLHFAVLGDFKDSVTHTEDASIPAACQKAISALNEKYGNHFYLLHRGQTYCERQNKWMGLERKRGAISDLNAFLRNQYDFAYTAGQIENLRGIRYVLTLDDDTLLPPGAAVRMVGTALHPLNKPTIENGIVTSGYGIIEPRVSVRLESAGKTFFSRIFAGQGGIDTYHSAVSEFYMDVFGETVFTGKGLYNVDTFSACMSIPPDTVLSHDLLEGSYVRCALASDVQVFDGFPGRFLAFSLRQHRWTRGDWQLLPWLSNHIRNENGQKIKNPLTLLSKWKIFDNLRRSITPIFQLILILSGCRSAILVALISLLLPMLLYLIDALLQKSYIFIGEKTNTGIVYGFKAILYQMTLSFAFLAHTAYTSFDAVCLGIYRACTHRRTLEWVTASDAETGSVNTLLGHYRAMLFSFVIGILSVLSVITGFVYESSIPLIFGIVWIFSPAIAYITGQEREPVSYGLTSQKEKLLLDCATRIWHFFADYMTEADHYLPPDNVQIKPYKGVAHRTSPTNIGLGMVACLCACKLGLITPEEMQNRISKTMDTVEKLETWKGHLYNWYDTITCKPLSPRYVSTVDSGNFLCYLVVAAMGISTYTGENHPLVKRLLRFVWNVDFKPLYNEKKKLLSIGFSVEENRLTNSYYDLLASEARQAGFLAIALGQLPPEHWFSLGRGLTSSEGFKGLISWSGTMFEYLMPLLIMKSYRGTLLDETYRFAVGCQKRYGRRRHVPWGVSESGFYAFDTEGNYQYKAFGVPELGLVRHLADDIVIAPYATILALMIDSRSAIANMQLLKREGLYGEYGFFEAADFTEERLSGTMRRGVIKSYMAHHQGMSLAAITNVLCDNFLQQKFHAYPPIQAIEPLLKERIPLRVPAIRDRQERVPPVRYKRTYDAECVRRFKNVETMPRPVQLLSNGSYHLCIDSAGHGYSTLDGIYLHKVNVPYYNGQAVYIVNTNSGQVMDGYGNDCTFFGHMAIYHGEQNKLTTTLQVNVDPEDNCEVRRITVCNTAGKPRTVEIYYYAEPSLTTPMASEAHNAFSNLFVQTEEQNGVLYAVRRKRTENEKTFIGFAAAIEEGNKEGALQYDTDRMSFWGRGTEFPVAVKSGSILAGKTGTVLDPAFALKIRLEIKDGESGSVTFLSGLVDTKERATQIVNKYKTHQKNVSNDAYQYKKNNSPIAFQEGEEATFLHAAGYLLYGFAPTPAILTAKEKNMRPRSDLWKFGISGDNPILFLVLTDSADLSLLESFLKAHRYFREYGIPTDLVVYCDESGGYTKPLFDTVVKKRVPNEFIFGRSDIDEGDKRLLIASASIYADKSTGGFSALPPYPVQNTKNVHIQEGQQDEAITLPNLLYANGFGGFDAQTGEYVILQTKRCQTPLPWSHIVANPHFGFIATESGGGNTWSNNSQSFRISPWYNDATIDPCGERLILKDGEDVWSPMAGIFPEEGQFVTRYGFGYVSYYRKTRNISHTATLFTPPQGEKKAILLSLTNHEKESRTLTVEYAFTPVLGTQPKPKDIIILETGKLVRMRNAFHDTMKTVCLSAGEGGQCGGDCTNVWARQSITLVPNETHNICFTIYTDDAPITDAASALKETKAYWQSCLSEITVETADASFNLLLSGWLLYQALCCRLFARSAFYQSGGATGFRDQLQDALALLYTKPELVRKQILYHASYQFTEGDVFHWWHEDEKGVRTRISDDRLWLPYAACRYYAVTKDASIWEEKTSFVLEPPLSPGEDERYTFVKERSAPDTLYEHCRRAIEISLAKGNHGLPLMGGGDWNDGMNRVGIEGNGESVWLCFFLKHVLDLFIPIAAERGDDALVKRYSHEKSLLIEAVDSSAWDKTHYARAFFDNGNPLGTSASPECAMDAISQSWSVIANCGSSVHQKTAMDSLYDTLVDREHRLIRLLTPAFEKTNPSPGYIQSYPAGIRENGGQYTHGAIWAAIAFAILGDSTRAYELFSMLNPILRSDTPASANLYKTEPYVMTADIYTAPTHIGRGGWSWYTGAASWMYQLGLDYLLGFEKKGDSVTFHPCLPADKLGFTLRMRFGNTQYVFHVYGPSEVIQLIDDGETHELTVGKNI
ncbi:MAG: glucoamylase family protein [Clostridia bacterium]|nr:glucoamylase family protein [Clostridia bacterium]